MAKRSRSDEWTTETLRIHLEGLLNAHAELDQNRHERESEAIKTAADALDKRLDGVNEFRAQLGDQARSFLPRPEYDVQQKALEERMTKLETNSWLSLGQKNGMDDATKIVVGALSILLTAASVAVAILALH